MAAYVFELAGSLTVKNGTLNLSGKGFHTTNGDVVLENITMNCTERVAGVYKGSLTIDKNCILKTTGSDATLMVAGYGTDKNNVTGTPTKVTISGKVYNDSGYYVLSGNGNDMVGTDIVIKEGAVLEGTNGAVGMYFPQAGTLTMEKNSKLVGDTGLYIKSGKANIDGEVAATAVTGEMYKYHGSGFESVGDAIAIEDCDYPAAKEGEPALVIGPNAVLSSVCGDKVRAYAPLSTTEGEADQDLVKIRELQSRIKGYTDFNN